MKLRTCSEQALYDSSSPIEHWEERQRDPDAYSMHGLPKKVSNKTEACRFCGSPIQKRDGRKNVKDTDESKFATVGCTSAIVVVCLAMFLTSDWDSGPNRNYRNSSGTSSSNSEVDACIERGIQYFKDIGSYPTLSSPPNRGRSAEVVARERCNRTTTAFP